MRRSEARQDFLEVRRVASDICVVPWYLGLLDADESRWDNAAREMTRSADCYTETAAMLRKELATLPDDLEPQERQREAADLNRRIADSERQAARSSLNAANAHTRQGQTTDALVMAARAAVHPELKSRADALIQALQRQ